MYILTKNLIFSKNVDFAGYSVPHPLENKMKIRVQSNKIPATKAMVESAEILKEICEHINYVFERNISNYENDKNN